MRHRTVLDGTEDYVFLIGREAIAENGVLSVRDPALRVLPVGHLPVGVELGAVFAHLGPAGDSSSGRQVHLEVVRPSGTPVLTMSGIIGEGTPDQSPVWAHTLHVVVDEPGSWIISVESGGKRAARVLDIVLEAER